MQPLGIFLNLERKMILIVGGGDVATSKLRTLLSYTNNVKVVALSINANLQTLLKQNSLDYYTKPYHPTDLLHVHVVIVATDDKTLNERVCTDARQRNILVNVVDTPRLCDFSFASLVQRDELQIAISTNGHSPVLGRLVKQMIEKILPSHIVPQLKLTKLFRTKVANSIKNIQQRRLFWQNFFLSTQGQQIVSISQPQLQQQQFLLYLKQHSELPNTIGTLYLVGAGPGNPELLTLQAIHILSQADVVISDRLVNPQIVSRFARRDASILSLSQKYPSNHAKQLHANLLIKQSLQQNKLVVRLKGGDPALFANSYSEIQVCRELRSPYFIVPGVTSALAAAAAASIPLSQRQLIRSVRFITLPQQKILPNHFWQNMTLHYTNETTVFYMSSQHVFAICSKLMSLQDPHDNPQDIHIVVVENASLPTQKITRSSVSHICLNPSLYEFSPPAIVIVNPPEYTQHIFDNQHNLLNSLSLVPC